MNVKTDLNTAVMISILPKWCELILNGEKTIEVRKRPPNLTSPFKCYIYCTKAQTIGDFILLKSKENKLLFPEKKVTGINKGFAKQGDIHLKGKVIAEFTCREIEEFDYNKDGCGLKEEHRLCECSKIFPNDLYHYLQGKKAYGLHISDVIIYDTPKEISDFGIVKAPQSWCYIKTA